MRSITWNSKHCTKQTLQDSKWNPECYVISLLTNPSFAEHLCYCKSGIRLNAFHLNHWNHVFLCTFTLMEAPGKGWMMEGWKSIVYLENRMIGEGKREWRYLQAFLSAKVIENYRDKREAEINQICWPETKIYT